MLGRALVDSVDELDHIVFKKELCLVCVPQKALQVLNFYANTFSKTSEEAHCVEVDAKSLIVKLDFQRLLAEGGPGKHRL